MFDCVDISRLYNRVLDKDMEEYKISEDEIFVGIRSMNEVYKPDEQIPDRSTVVDFNNAANRCAYLYKYAALHTAMVRDLMFSAIRRNYDFFENFLQSQKNLKICSLGGGPGSDVIGVLASLCSIFNSLQASVTVIDYMINWSETFGSIINELSTGCYGSFRDMKSLLLQWRYIGANLLKPFTEDVEQEISEASIITMVKFVSAASCKNTEFMIANIFKTMKQGALLFFIDNSARDFEDFITKAALKYNFIPIFRPMGRENYINDLVKFTRFGVSSCIKTKVNVMVLQKPFLIEPQLRVTIPNTYRNATEDSSLRSGNIKQEVDCKDTPPTSSRCKIGIKSHDCFFLARFRHHLSRKLDKIKFKSSVFRPKSRKRKIKTEECF